MKKSTNPATPNKPLVLTAPASTEEPVTQLGRRHIGESLGGRALCHGWLVDALRVGINQSSSNTV